ncbi:hypothetical protein [Halomonas litopenaei]|uniref:hypothetical protein n=1 Tax=Halomonas litopenaei TaxID=2109328 RepID=UPI001A90CB00|nr:hypothetical protein [Halomonas litopenaei]MBN8411304.1 hypothetical protein [Halomonas litopenaei]
MPEGRSVWEIGTNGRVSQKANEDYQKRSSTPGDITPSEVTYVFVTPRRWHGKEDWVHARNVEEIWKEVRAYDADDIAHWMERAPSVHAWFSALLGKDPYEAESLETWWEEWSQATIPQIPPELLLSGRKASVENIIAHLQKPSAPYTVAADSREEAVAFLAASLQGLHTPDGLLERAILVRNPSAWRRLSFSETSLILLPLFEGSDAALAFRNGHHVIVPIGREIGTEAQYELPRLHRDGIQTALTEAGLPESKASRFATLGRRSLLSMRRAMAVLPAVQTPEWSKPEYARKILPAMLAGQWVDGNEADREIIASLAGQPYEEVASTLTRWAYTSDPPVRRVGDVWLVASKQDAWTLLARHLLPDDLRHFQEAALEVLSSDDPTLDLAPQERFMAPIIGEVRPYSTHIMDGVADTIALMGSAADLVELIDRRRSDDEAAIIVRRLLSFANEDPSGRRWSTISGVLPALAEAAPYDFLRAVDAGLSGGNPISGVFQDHDDHTDGFMLGGASPHTGVLWALEALAWKADYIVPVSLTLAKLAVVDPGGRLTNRPINSLREIHVLWIRGTSASLDERFQAIDEIRRRVPSVAWDLLLKLLPSKHETFVAPYSPKWRDWKPDDTRSVLYGEHVRGVHEACERIIVDADDDSERLIEVVGRYADFPSSFRARIAGKMSGLDPTMLSQADRQVLSDTARDLVSHHRAYPDTDWSLPPKDLDQLEESCEHLTPEDPCYRHRWLFLRGSPRAFEGQGDYQQQQEALQEAQTEAVREVYAKGGIDSVFAWAEQISKGFGPRWIGIALGGIELSSDEEERVFQKLIATSESLIQLAEGFVARRISILEGGWLEWAYEIVKEHPGWTSDHTASFLAILPATPKVWDISEAAGHDVEKIYWNRVKHYGLPERGEACLRSARKLIEYGRPYTAVELLDLYNTDIPQGPLDDLTAIALEASAENKTNEPLGQMFPYHVGRHLDRLAEHGFDEERLAALEWMCLPLFRFDKRRSPVLHRKLSNSPKDFVAVVSMIYQAEHEEPIEPSESEKTRARTARNLLRSWKDVPGRSEEGGVDRENLFSWVREARDLLEQANRLGSGDLHIGQVLRHGPLPVDGEVWPSEPICDLIEAVASDDLEGGFFSEIIDSRGFTTRGITDGGAQEQELAEQYRQYSRMAATAWPRTSALLEQVAKSYETQARYHDLDADLRQDLWY